jgi:hypothetical protein
MLRRTLQGAIAFALVLVVVLASQARRFSLSRERGLPLLGESHRWLLPPGASCSLLGSPAGAEGTSPL